MQAITKRKERKRASSQRSSMTSHLSEKMNRRLSYAELLSAFGMLPIMYKPTVINGKSYGLIEGYPETQGVYTAYMTGYYSGQESLVRL